MIAAGLHITDLNLFDGTGEFLIANVHQMREAEETMEKVSVLPSIDRDDSAHGLAKTIRIAIATSQC